MKPNANFFRIVLVTFTLVYTTAITDAAYEYYDG
jgi:hypothetical protein